MRFLNKCFFSTGSNSNGQGRDKLRINSSLDSVVFVDNKSVMLIQPLEGVRKHFEILKTMVQLIKMTYFIF
jgi:hypothetical protein